MDFTISEERRLLGESLTRLLQDACGFETRTQVAYDAPYHSPALWSALSELGVHYAFLPEHAGGIGGTGFDVLAVFEPLGQALCPEPVLGQLMALRLLAAAGGSSEIEQAISGQVKWALASGETDAPWDIADTRAEAAQGTAGWQVNGAKSVVYGGAVADRLLVPARAGDAIALFAVDGASTVRQGYAMIDGGGAAEIRLDAAPATPLLADAGAAIEDALDWGRLALAAEALGVMEAAFAMLVDYLKTRQQFGRPLAQFQALQHRTVDLKVEMEQARSITIRAAGAMGTAAQARAVAQMKTLVGRTAHKVAEETIQMQGGIAVTWEYPASHYAKRLTMIDHQLGDADFHLTRLTA